MTNRSYPQRAELAFEFLKSPVAAAERLEQWLAEYPQLSASDVYARLNAIFGAVRIAADQSPETERFLHQLSNHEWESDFPGTTVNIEEMLLDLDPDNGSVGPWNPNDALVRDLSDAVAEHRDYLAAIMAVTASPNDQMTGDDSAQGEKPRRLRGDDKRKRDEAIRFLKEQGDYTQDDLATIFNLKQPTINEILNPKP